MEFGSYRAVTAPQLPLALGLDLSSLDGHGHRRGHGRVSPAALVRERRHGNRLAEGVLDGGGLRRDMCDHLAVICTWYTLHAVQIKLVKVAKVRI